VLGNDYQPFIVCVRDNIGDLVGVAPLYFFNYRLINLVPYKTLRMIGDSSTGSEYQEWIVRKHGSDEIYEAIVNSLSKAHNRWDCIWMPRLSGWSGSHKTIEEKVVSQGWYASIRERDFSYFKIPETMAEFLGGLSRKARYQTKRDTKKIFDQNGATLRSCEDMDDLPEFLRVFFELHNLRWQVKDKKGAFKRNPTKGEFYRTFVPLALERRWLRFFGVEVDGEFKAIQIGYVYNNIFHSLQEGFDPDYLKGVGNALRAKIIEACIKEGLDEYDFLGGYSEHKKRWTAIRRSGYDLFIGNRSIKNSLLFRFGLWPTGRYLTGRRITVT